eukprot:8285909-Pyramimonas_sp.AAC.1
MAATASSNSTYGSIVNWFKCSMLASLAFSASSCAFLAASSFSCDHPIDMFNRQLTFCGGTVLWLTVLKPQWPCT